VEPLWSLYIAARKPLVMQGFLVPKSEEIMQSLVELGVSPDGPLADLAAAPQLARRVRHSTPAVR